MAQRGFRKACGQPGKTVDALVHVILGDGRTVTFKKEQRLFRRSARTASAELGVLVRPNGFAEVDPEPDEIQAIDRCPIDISIRLVGHNDEEWQLRETTAIFDDLTAARPDVPVLSFTTWTPW